MTDKIKLILALDQVNNIANLLEGNEYESYLYSRLISVKYEIERQLTNLKQSDTILK